MENRVTETTASPFQKGISFNRLSIRKKIPTVALVMIPVLKMRITSMGITRRDQRWRLCPPLQLPIPLTNPIYNLCQVNYIKTLQSRSPVWPF